MTYEEFRKKVTFERDFISGFPTSMSVLSSIVIEAGRKMDVAFWDEFFAENEAAQRELENEVAYGLWRVIQRELGHTDKEVVYAYRMGRREGQRDVRFGGNAPAISDEDILRKVKEVAS